MSAAVEMLPGGRCDGLLLAVMDSPEKRLPELWRVICEGRARGHLGDDAYSMLSNAYEARGNAFRVRRQFGVQRIRNAVPALPERPTRRRHARMRRRVWSASGGLPPQLRDNFTPGEQAVAAVVRSQIARSGHCALSYASIAKRAGLLGTTVVKRFVRLARKLGLIRVQMRPVKGGKNLPNIITLDLDSRGGAGRLGDLALCREPRSHGFDASRRVAFRAHGSALRARQRRRTGAHHRSASRGNPGGN